MEQLHGSRSRWAGLEINDKFETETILNNAELVGPPGKEEATYNALNNNQNFGQIRNGLGSFLRRQDDGPGSDYYRCYYSGVQEPLL